MKPLETENLFLEIEKFPLEGDLNFGFSQGRFPISRLLKISVSNHVSKNGSSVSSSPQESNGNGFWETPCRFPQVIRRFPEEGYYRRKPRFLRKAFKGIQSDGTACPAVFTAFLCRACAKRWRFSNSAARWLESKRRFYSQRPVFTASPKELDQRERATLEFPNTFSRKSSMVLTAMDLSQRQPKRFRRKAVRKSGPPQRKMGRPSKLRQVNTTKLVDDIARGVPVPIACAAAGIEVKTFYNWLDGQPEFARMLATRKQEVILEAINGIRTGSKDEEWRGHAWFLERVYKDHFAPPTPGFALGVQQNFTITIEKAKELEDQRARLLPEISSMLGLTNGHSNGADPRT
jgi:hypothetical protein